MVVICSKLFSTNKFHKTTFQINVRSLKNMKAFFFIEFLNLKFYIAHPVVIACINLQIVERLSNIPFAKWPNFFNAENLNGTRTL